jgi:PAS domain S-box-containing protein
MGKRIERDSWSSARSVGVYAAAAGLWILLSDRAAQLLFKTTVSLTVASTVKGWLFVAVTAAILFGVLERDRRVSERFSAAIREAHERASSTLDSAPQAIMFIDAEGVVTYANREVERTFGIAPRELLGTHGIDLGWTYTDVDGTPIPREDLPGATVARTGQPVHGLAVRITTAEGVSRVLSMNAVPMTDDRGLPGALAAYTDISDTVDAQERLEHVNRLYSVLGEASQAIIGLAQGGDALSEVCRSAVETGLLRMAWVGLVDEDTKIVRPVAWAGRIEGYLDGLVITTLDQADGRGPAGTSIRENRTVVSNDIETDPMMGPWRDGATSRGYVASISIPIMRDGVPVGAFMAYASEPRFFGAREVGLLERLAGDVSFAMDFQSREDKRRRYPGGCRDQRVRQPGHQSVQPGVRRHARLFSKISAHLRSSSSEAGHLHYEALHVRKDGSTFPVDIDLTIVFDDAGTPRYGIATVVDITDRKATEEELEEYRENLEELVDARTAELERVNSDLVRATEAKSQFLANMSHELRTPLNSIIGFTGVMQQGMAGPLTQEQDKQLGMVYRSGRYLLSLINDVLDLSRIEAGRVRVEVESFDMRDLLSALVQTLDPLAREKGLQLAIDGPDGPTPVMSDRGKIQQILLNLVGNAIKFTEHGGVTVHTEARPDEVVVAVTDTGVGIGPEEIGHIFDEFHQVARASGDKTQGTGLGLTICRRLARVLGGDVTVGSMPGEGSTFTLSVPTTAPGGSGISRAAGIDLRGRTAMVVDDDPSALALMTLYLEREGIDVVQVEDGAEALAVARERCPDVILLDITLPAMSGQQVLRRLRGDPVTAPIPVICVSAHQPGEYDSEGPASQVVKPVLCEELIAHVERVLGAGVRHNGNRPVPSDEGEA